MAEKRMFAKTIIDSDAFLDMPQSTQLLYFHLCMRADDDGFVNSPKRIMRTIGCSDDDLKILFAKNFIIPFESGVVVIRHWRIHNYIRKDTYNPTQYDEEMSKLDLNENKTYALKDVDGSSTARPRLVDADKISVDQISSVKDREDYILSDSIREIIDYLNEMCGTKYKASTKKTQDCIKARLNEGFTVEDFKTVIYKKAKQWQKDAKMCKFLRPETLFGTKFEGYLNEMEPVVEDDVSRWRVEF